MALPTTLTPNQVQMLDAFLKLCASKTGEVRAGAGELRAALEGTTFNRYHTSVKKTDHVLTRKEFLKQAGHELTGYDGFGHPMKDGMADEKTWIDPDDLGNLPEDATHIVWYNR